MTADEGYAILAGRFRDEAVIQRSRFITTVDVVASVDEAHQFIGHVAAEFPDATHNCWAFLAGPPGSTARIGMSDAGEPSGTAGKPMLQALVHGGVGDVAAVVTRYFGGTKLGTGGLVRAYGGCVKDALERAPKTRRIDWVHVRVLLAYPEQSAVEHLYPRFLVERRGEEFSDVVVHRLRLPRARRDPFARAVLDATRGRAVVVTDDSPA